MANNVDIKDEDIFSDEDFTQFPLSKGVRFIPSGLSGDFLSWLVRTHPEVQILGNLSLQQVEQLVDEFEYFTGYSYDFTPQQWQTTLLQQ